MTLQEFNLGISKMAEACPGTTARKLDWLASLHIRDEAYTKALAELVNHHHRHPFSEHWGEGTTSSLDGQRFRASARESSPGRSISATPMSRACSSTPTSPALLH